MSEKFTVCRYFDAQVIGILTRGDIIRAMAASQE